MKDYFSDKSWLERSENTNENTNESSTSKLRLKSKSKSKIKTDVERNVKTTANTKEKAKIEDEEESKNQNKNENKYENKNKNTELFIEHTYDILTLEEAARECNVSTKTISRWRKQGLESEVRLIASRNRVIIRREKLDAFAAAQPVRVEKGRKFSQMSPYERSEILDRAARMAAAGRKLTEVIRLLAVTTGRSAETIRYTLKNHDEQNPREAIFPKYQRTLDDLEKARLLDDFRRGVRMEVLSARYLRTKTSIYRIVAETRARQIREMNLEYIPCPEIQNAAEGSDLEREILDPMPTNDSKLRRPRLPGGLPSYLASLYTVPLLTFAQE